MWEDNLGKVKARRNKNSKPYERPKSILRRVTDSVTGLLPQPSWLANWLQSSKKEEDENEEIEEEQPVPSTSSANEGSNSYESVNTESFIFRRPPGASKEQSNGRALLNVPALDLFPEPVIPETSSREQLIQTNGDDDSNSESTSGCSSLLPHPEHKRENRNVELPSLSVVEPLNIDSSSLQIIGSSLSKSLAVDLKNSRGRKTLSLHTFSQDTSLVVTPTEDTRFHKDAEGASNSFFDKDDTTLNRSASKRDLSLPQMSAFGSKRPRFNITSFGPTAAEARRSLLNESVVDSPFYAGRTTYGGASAYRRATLQPTTTLLPYARKRIQARPSSISSAPPAHSGSATTTTSSGVVLSSSAQRILQALESMSTPVRDAKRIPAASTSRRSSSFQDQDVSFSGFGLSRRRPNLGPPATKLSVGTPAQVVCRPPPAFKTLAETAPVSSTPISAQAGGKMRSRKSAPLRESVREATRIREEQEEEPITSDLTAVLMPIASSSLPSFSLLPPPSVGTAAPVVSSQCTVKTSFVSTPSSNGLFNTSLASAPALRPAFTFSAPLVTVSLREAETAISSKPLSFNFSSPLLVKPISRKTPEKEPSTFQPVVELKTGSVLEALEGKKSLETVRAVENKQPPTATFSGFGDKFKPPSDSWTCSVCCVSNPKDKSKCVACESPGPSAAAAPKPVVPTPVTPAPPTKGFGDQFKMTTSQWECPVCMVRNLEKDNRCKSCEEPRPGSKPATTPSSVSNYKFGVQSTPAPANLKFGTESSTSVAGSSEKPISGGFSFGSKKEETSAGFKFGDTVEGSKEVGGFKFGSAMEPAKKVETESSGFKFGATMEPAKTVDAPGFKFGGSMETQKKTEEKVAGFQFASDKKAEEPTLPKTTTVSQPVVPEATGLFSFQSVAEPTKKPEEPKALGLPALEPIKKSEAEPQTFKMPTVSSSAPGFSMASTTTTAASKSSPIFSFGPTSTVSEAKKNMTLETGSVMDILGKKPVAAAPSAFGQTPVSSAPFSFGAATEQAKPSFSFAKPAAAPEKSTFVFGATATEEPSATKISTVQPTTSTPFSFTGAPTSTPSLSMFKPSSVATPSFNFGGPTAFGASTTSAPPVFGATPSTATSTAPTFGLPTTTTTTAPPAFGLPTTTAAPIAFGLPTTSAVTTGSAPASSLFSFGATPAAATPAVTSVSTAVTTSNSFAFGLASTSSASTPFAFGATSSAPPPYPSFAKEGPKLAASGFSTAAPAAPAQAVPALFTFGSSSAAVPATTTPSEAPKVQFSFGTPQQTTPSTAAAPSFGSFSATKNTTAPFSFGAGSPASSTPAFGDITPKSSVAPFGTPATTPFGSLPPTAFGAPSAASSSASPFSFGAQSSAAPSAFSAAPSFNFGASAPAVAPPQQQPAVGPVFQFGSAATPAGNAGFPFGSTPAFTPSDAPSPGFASNLFGGNPFDNQGSASGPNRKIRKAVRRR